MTNTERLNISQGLIKHALIADALGHKLGDGFLGGAAQIGASMIPGVASVDSLHDAYRAGGTGLARLGAGDYAGAARSGLKTLGHVGLAGLGLVPGMGLLRPGARLASKIPTMMRGARGIGNIAQKTIRKAPLGSLAVSHPNLSSFVGSSAIEGAGPRMDAARAGRVSSGQQMGDTFNQLRNMSSSMNWNTTLQQPNTPPTWLAPIAGGF